MNFKLLVDFSCHPLKDCILPSDGAPDVVPPKDAKVFESFNQDTPLLVPFLAIKTAEIRCVNCHNFPNGYHPVGFQGGLEQETKDFVKKSILPNDITSRKLLDLRTSLGINENTAVLHIRGGDHQMESDIDIPRNLSEYIQNVIIPTHGNNVLVISDNKYIKSKLCETYKFKDTGCLLVHLGQCKDSDPLNVATTFMEFVLMSKAARIYQWSVYMGSGFSELCAAIYDIPLKKINV